MKAILWAVFLSLAASLASVPALACSAPAPTRAGAAPLGPRPDQAVFSAALLAWVNYERCKRGLGALRTDKGLVRAATTHAGWMARAGQLSHVSRVAGQQKLRQRIRANGVSYRTAAENIAVFERFRFGTGPFRILSKSACRYEDPATGARIAPHSAASLAQAVVAGWMASAGHRRNILNRRITRAGAGVALDRKGGVCGRYFVTQDYAG